MRVTCGWNREKNHNNNNNTNKRRPRIIYIYHAHGAPYKLYIMYCILYNSVCSAGHAAMAAESYIIIILYDKKNIIPTACYDGRNNKEI